MTKYQETIEDLIKDIKSRLREFGKENSVLSINFVGSFGGENHVPTIINDLDILILYDNVSEEILQKNKDLLLSIEKDHIDKDVDILHSFVIGPQKFAPKKDANLLLHNLVYNIDEFKNESNLVIGSWKEWNKPIWGRKLDTIDARFKFVVPEIEPYDVISSPFGIDDCEKALEYGKLLAFTWNAVEDRCVKQKTIIDIMDNKYFYGEIIGYSVIYAILNSVRAVKRKKISKSESQELLPSLIDIKDVDLISDIIVFKEKIRENPKEISLKEIMHYKKRASLFLKNITDEMEILGFNNK